MGALEHCRRLRQAAETASADIAGSRGVRVGWKAAAAQQRSLRQGSPGLSLNDGRKSDWQNRRKGHSADTDRHAGCRFRLGHIGAVTSRAICGFRLCHIGAVALACVTIALPWRTPLGRGSHSDRHAARLNDRQTHADAHENCEHQREYLPERRRHHDNSGRSTEIGGIKPKGAFVGGYAAS